jgi:DNA repair exonuclease SbcCD ATPase subunit
MINKIILKYFGKFINKSFDLSPITVFIGKNESGKTTLFDAIFDCICSPNNKVSHGKRLKNRYGDKREAELEFNGKPLELDTDEFINLNAIHSGNIVLDFSSGNSWIDKIKSALFYGGVDPNPIIYELEQESSTHANKPHIRDLRKIEEEKERIENELQEISRKKEEILNNEKNILKQDNNLKDLEFNSTKLENRIAQLKKQLEQQNKIKQRNEYLSVLSFLNSGEKIKEQLDNLKVFKEARAEELNMHTTQINNLESKYQEEKGSIQILQKDIENRKEKLNIKNKQKEEKKYLSELAHQLLSKIKNIETPVIKKIKWNPVLLIFASVSIISGILLFLLIPGFELKLILMCTGLISGIIMLFLSKKVILTQDTSGSKNFIAELKDEWRTRLRRESTLTAETKDGLVRELIQYENDYDVLVKNIQEEISEFELKEKNLIENKNIALELVEEIKIKNEALNSRLKEYGLSNIYDYYKKMENYNNLNSSYKNWGLELNKKLLNFKKQDATILKTEIDMQIRNIDNEITEEQKTETAVKQITNELSNLELELRELQNRKAGLKNYISENKGVVKGSLGDIPEKIVSLEKSKKYFQEQIDEINLNIKASALAKDIFTDISENMDTLMYDLQDEIKDQFANIIPDLREVTIKKLDKDAISITDAGGEPRILDNLSRGTVDTFYFSCRLALVQRAFKEESILILDEPFHSMDKERELKALELLNEFYKTNNWQIILFSKDESIKDNISNIFSDAKIHIL